MWSRAELKDQAKNVLKGSYWEGVVVYLIVAGISLGASFIVGIIPVISFFGSFALTFFVLSPLTVGMNFFFMQNRLAPPQTRNLFFAFEGERYLKIVGAMAWQYLFIFLWSLIPSTGITILMVKALSSSILYGMSGSFPVIDESWAAFAVVCMIIFVAGMIIVAMKEIAYSMTPYILTDNPHIGYERALKLSIAMTYGQKWNIFVLGLSFLGWILLSAITAFIGIIFLAPYMMATYAELYVRLRDSAIRNGLTTPQELNLIAIDPNGTQSGSAPPAY